MPIAPPPAAAKAVTAVAGEDRLEGVSGGGAFPPIEYASGEADSSLLLLLLLPLPSAWGEGEGRGEGEGASVGARKGDGGKEG